MASEVAEQEAGRGATHQGHPSPVSAKWSARSNCSQHPSSSTFYNSCASQKVYTGSSRGDADMEET